MITTTLHMDDEVGMRREASGKTWKEIVMLGIEAAEKEQNKKTEAQQNNG